MSKHKAKKEGKDKAAIFILVTSLILIMIGTVINNVLSHERLAVQSNADQNGFHLTEEIYGSNTVDAVKFNVHVKFNPDGCDGDITLYQGDKLIAGPNAWNNFGGKSSFDYSEQYTASPYVIPNDGQPHAISFRGAVNRCPKSPGTLWDEISCTVTFDASGLPQVAPGDKCTIKNLAEIQSVPVTSPKVIPSPPRSTPGVEVSKNAPGTIPNDTPIPGEPTPTATPTIIPNTPTPVPTAIIQFMGVKLGSLSSSQPLNIFWDFIRKIIGL